MSGSSNPFGPNPQGYGNPYQAPGGFGPQFAPPPQQPPSPALGIASLVCGIASIFFSCCCGLISVPLGLAAIGLGGFALTKSDGPGKVMAICGIVCGILALGLFVVSLVIALNPQWIEQFQQQMQNR
jgi:hypothetical protein